MHLSEGRGSVIRSLGEDARKTLVVSSSHGRARMVATSRRKPMVAHNITDAPSLLADVVRRRPFFQEDPLIMFLTLGLYVMSPDKVEVEPCFPRLHEEWRKHHEPVLSSADQIQAV